MLNDLWQGPLLMGVIIAGVVYGGVVGGVAATVLVVLAASFKWDR